MSLTFAFTIRSYESFASRFSMYPSATPSVYNVYEHLIHIRQWDDVQVCLMILFDIVLYQCTDHSLRQLVDVKDAGMYFLTGLDEKETRQFVIAAAGQTEMSISWQVCIYARVSTRGVILSFKCLRSLFELTDFLFNQQAFSNSENL